MGPPRNFWMRFKSKHSYLIDLSKKLKNYKSVCKSLAFRHRQNVFFKWNNCDIFQSFSLLKKCKVVTIENTLYFYIISNVLHLKSDEKVCFGISVELFGNQITVNNFICTSFHEHLPIFSKVLFLFVYNSKLYAVCHNYKTLCISKKYLGYIITYEDNNCFLYCLSNLKYFKSYKMYEKDLTKIIITEYFLLS